MKCNNCGIELDKSNLCFIYHFDVSRSKTQVNQVVVMCKICGNVVKMFNADELKKILGKGCGVC